MNKATISLQAISCHSERSGEPRINFGWFSQRKQIRDVSLCSTWHRHLSDGL